ncbi:hypothetical protein BH24ACT26_BH24ACT26_10930 [soil metagenome]
MATNGSPDFVLCYYCPNEATQAVDVPKESDIVRRWVCRYHAERRPRRRRWKMKVPVLR